MRVACLLACALAWGCRPAPAPPTAPIRVVDVLRPSHDARIAQGAEVTLDRDNRRVVLTPASTVGLATLDRDTPQLRYRVSFMPDVAAGWRRVQLVRTTQVGKEKITLPAVAMDLSGEARTIPLAPSETPAEGVPLMVHATLGPLPSVETQPFVVDDGAELAFDVGVHAIGPRVPAWIGARVAVVEGRRATTVWRGVLSGTELGWQPARVPLGAFAGRRVRLRFVTRPDGAARAAGMLAVFGEPLVLPPPPPPHTFVNVVLVSMDTLRAHSVGAYGCEHPTTPTLDALAASGVLFENAFSTAAFTLPGHLSMLTGLWFRTHGALGMTASLALEHRTVAERLRSAGYATGAFTSGAWLVPWVGFRRGFDLWYEQPSGTVDTTPRPYDAFTRGLDWMRTNADRPFFAFLHNYLVHAPYLPPPPYRSMFAELPPGTPDDVRARLAYEQEVRYGDDQLRALLEGLDALGVADRTLVIVTADHGEQFREHGGTEHTYDLHDETVRVPLVMRLLGAIPRGRRVAEPVSLADVAPTIVDVVGLPPIDGTDGTSLLPLATGTATRLPRDGVFSEAESRPNLGWVDLTAVHTPTVSCIHDARADTDECWDRRVDPWQEQPPVDATDASPDVVAAKDTLRRFVASRPPPTIGAPMLGGWTGGPAPASPTTPKPPPNVEEEKRQQLRALGYAE